MKRKRTPPPCRMCWNAPCAPKSQMCQSCIDEGERDQAEISRLISDGHTHHCACRQVWGDGECECEKKGIIPGGISRAIEHVMGHLDHPGGPLDRSDVEVEDGNKGHAFDEMWGVTKRG